MTQQLGKTVFSAKNKHYVAILILVNYINNLNLYTLYFFLHFSVF